MIKLNSPEKIVTFCVLVIVVIISGLTLSNWLSNDFTPQLPTDGIELSNVKIGSEVFTFNPARAS